MNGFARILICSALAPAAIVAATPERVVRLSEPVTVTTEYEEFGAPVQALPAALSLEELVAAGDRYIDEKVTVTTRIAKVCQKKGCFFIASEGETVARITFADYAFFIPTDAAGKTVTLNGTFTRQEITAAQARHYREDLGKNADEDPELAADAGIEYRIVATAIRIPRG